MRRDVRRWTPATPDERDSRLGRLWRLRAIDRNTFHAG